MPTDRRYKYGTLEKKSTARGPCWYLRWTDGPVRPMARVGLVSDFPSKRAADRAADVIRERINLPQAARDARDRTMGELVERYMRDRMPERHSTRRAYTAILNTHISPKWGKYKLREIAPLEVESWLLRMDCSTRYRGHIHGLMRILFRFAMLCQWLPAAVNPMSLFSLPGATKRAKQPETLSIEQYRQILEVLREPYRTMVAAATCTGMRCSELTALRWRDLDFVGERIHITRGIVEGREGDVKTAHSKRPLPLHPFLAAVFLQWRKMSEFAADEDYVFASRWVGGEKPYRSGNVQTKELVPAGEKVKLGFRLGWHCFRHTYRAMLRQTGAPIDVQRDLMRHADLRTTVQVYGGTDLEELRPANSEMVESLFRGRLQ